MRAMFLAVRLAAPLLATALAAQAPTCTFTAFGRPCGGVLAGQQVAARSASGIRLDVIRAEPGGVAVLVLGQRARPVALPGSACDLLIDARAMYFDKVDRHGQVSFRFPMPATLPFDIDAQVVIVVPHRAGRTAEPTNGLDIHCQ